MDDQFEHGESEDYSQVRSTARIALYDDLRSAPRITEIHPAATTEFIEKLASTVYDQSHTAGGTVPYTVIREVTENFIHARFKEIVVSILDNGNTIRFADQGPGISKKEKAQLPGFTTATEPMKRYIRGVGSGLPIVKEYLGISHGLISIEDNLESGSVITISMSTSKPEKAHQKSPMPVLDQRQKDFLRLLSKKGALGVTELSSSTGVPQSSTHAVLVKLEKLGLVEVTAGQKRILTDYGFEVASQL